MAAMTVLDKFEIAVVTSSSAWHSGGMRRRSLSALGGVESHSGICRQGAKSEKKLGIIIESHVLIGTFPLLTAHISQSGSRAATVSPPSHSRPVSLPPEE